jgi:hypothetical protein
VALELRLLLLQLLLLLLMLLLMLLHRVWPELLLRLQVQPLP